MREVRFTLHLGTDELLRYYRGTARAVIAVTDDGQRIQFPAESLRPFVTPEGVHGRFALEFDERAKLKGLRRI